MHNKPHTNEAKQKIGEATKLMWKNPLIRNKIKEKMMGRPAHNKGIWNKKICPICSNEFEFPNYLNRKYCSNNCRSKGMIGKTPDRKNWFPLKGENHPRWKGDKASYSAIHHWLKKHKKKSEICEKCGKLPKTRLECSNISGKYKRDVDDYEWLCVRCHRIKDNNMPYLQRRELKDSKEKKELL